jgi:hypothetical protein
MMKIPKLKPYNVKGNMFKIKKSIFLGSLKFFLTVLRFFLKILNDATVLKVYAAIQIDTLLFPKSYS